MPSRWVAFPRPAAILGIVAILTLQFGLLVRIFALEWAAQRVDQSRMSAFQRPDADWRGVTSPPIALPTAIPAREANLPDGEKVIGIEVDGVAKAYQFSAFEGKSAHLVNDIVENTAVSIAYCDISRCLRVFGAPRATSPLDLRVAGLLNGQMILKHGPYMHYQKSGKAVDSDQAEPTIPYASMEPIVTTWGQWRAAHSDTLIYLGPGRLKGIAR